MLIVKRKNVTIHPSVALHADKHLSLIPIKIQYCMKNKGGVKEWQKKPRLRKNLLKIM